MESKQRFRDSRVHDEIGEMLPSRPEGARAHGHGWSAAEPVYWMCADSLFRPVRAGEAHGIEYDERYPLD